MAYSRDLPKMARQQCHIANFLRILKVKLLCNNELIK